MADDKLSMDNIRMDDLVVEHAPATEQESQEEPLKSDQEESKSKNNKTSEDKTKEAEEYSDNYNEEEEEEEEGKEKEGQDEEEEEEEGNEDDQEKTFIEQLKEKFEIGEDKEYNDDEEGIEELAKDLAEEKANNQLNQFFEAYPDAYDLAMHLKSGGKVEDFIDNRQEPDYSKVELKEDDSESHKEYIRRNLEEKGLKEKKIERYIQASEDDDSLYEEAKESIEELKQRQEERKEEEDKKRKEQEEKEKQEREEHLNNIKQIIQAGEIAGVKLDKNEQKEFENYLFNPDPKTEETPAQKKMKNLPLEQRLLIDHLVFKDFKGIGGAKKEGSSNKKKTLSEQYNKRKPRMTNTGSSQSGSKGNIDMSYLK